MRRKQDTSDWEEIGDMLTPEGFKRLGVTDILRFEKDGEVTEWRVMRMNKRKRTCYIKQTRTYTQQEMDDMAENKGIGK